MSDTPRGADWWQASDGAWYPPNMTEASLRQPDPAEPTDNEPPYLALIYRRVHGVAVLLLTTVIGASLAAFGSTQTEESFRGVEELTSEGSFMVAAGGVVALVGVIAAAMYILGNGAETEAPRVLEDDPPVGRFFP
ncbi:MAG: hypothetical protein ACE367_11200 [Acidimicrobiales bacterium]